MYFLFYHKLYYHYTFLNFIVLSQVAGKIVIYIFNMIHLISTHILNCTVYTRRFFRIY